LIDTHLHLEELGDVTRVVKEAVDAGVTGLIAMGVDLERSRTAVSLAHQHSEVWAAVGHFPLEPEGPDIDALRELAADHRVVAIGEIGLDFEAVGGVEPARQIERLETLFGLARELSLPVSIHNRAAGEELVQAIKRHPGLRGAMHYFALEREWAERFLDLGFYLSFAGLITRPSRAALRDVVKRCPPDRLLLETDSPYGNAHKRMGVPNRPAYLFDTAAVVAELRGLELSELDDLETANAMTLFTRIRR
jgi:TatD DNase family protein